MEEDAGSGDVENLRIACEEQRRKLRTAFQANAEVEAMAKAFAKAFNAYQIARAAQLGMTVKKISAFHIMRNIEQIVSTIKE